MRGGNRRDLATERGELGCGVWGCGVDLVGGDDDVDAFLAQAVDDLLVAAGQTGLGVGHQHRQLRFFQGGFDLRFDRLLKRPVAVPREAAGVHEDRFPSAPTLPEQRLAVAPIPRQAGEVGDQRFAAAAQLVVERGFADVGTPDEHDDRAFAAWVGHERCSLFARCAGSAAALDLQRLQAAVVG